MRRVLPGHVPPHKRRCSNIREERRSRIARLNPCEKNKFYRENDVRFLAGKTYTGRPWFSRKLKTKYAFSDRFTTAVLYILHQFRLHSPADSIFQAVHCSD
jgi:hypothetical protein